MENTQPTRVPASTPQEPIIVLGKADDFLYPMPTVADTVDSINRYLTGAGLGAADPTIPQRGRLRLDELDFFDATARRLEPVTDDDGALVGLVVEPDAQAAIRTRVSRLVTAAGERIQDHPDAAALAEKLPVMPSNDLSFDEFLDEIVNDLRMRPNRTQECSYLAWLAGLCG